MARLKTHWVTLMTAALIAVPPGVQAQSPEEQAALDLFEKGKAAFKAGKFEEALPLFRNAHLVIDNNFTRFYLGRGLAAVGKCSEALPFFAALEGKLPPQVEKLRSGDEALCLMKEARTAVAKDDCKAGLPMLEKLAGRVTGEEEAWRASKAEYCSTRATDFPTDTPSRKAAYSLYEAAEAAVAAGDNAGAIPLLEKTLALADEPIVRRKLAALQIGGGGCLPALQTLEGIPKPQRTAADQDLSEACGTYAPRGELSGADLAQFVTQVTSGLAARRGGRLSEALHHLDGASQGNPSPAVQALTIDLLYEMKRCKQYAVRLAEASPAAQQAVTKRAERLAACGVDAGGLAGAPPAGGGATHGTSLTVDGGSVTFSTTQILEWSLIGTGVTCMAISGWMAMEAQESYDQGSDLTNFANDPGTSASDSGVAYAEAHDLQDEGDETMENAQLMLGIGAAVTLGGVALILIDKYSGAQEASTAESLEISPWASPNAFGLVGRF